MNSFKYTNFEDAITFARSQEGKEYIDSQYVGETSYETNYFGVYYTPKAAALAALQVCDDDEIEELRDEFSVTIVRCDGILLYGADTWLNDSMTHTDEDGFVSFLKGNDSWLSEWIQDIYDLEIDSKLCLPSNLKFDPAAPWTLHEAKSISRNTEKLLSIPSIYYSSARPQLHKLSGGDAMLIIFDSNIPKEYGILNASAIKKLRIKLKEFYTEDIDYTIALCKGLELCYYNSREHDEEDDY